MQAIFDNPVLLGVLILIIIVIFGANKLPRAAQSLGRSMKIFKAEINEGKDDSAKKTPDAIEADTQSRPSYQVSQDDKRPEAQ